ncbi:hypothetical protein [Usitatibacter palustris]|uniref:Uncharacterized protein n=1 Tax=Usitatibacter palustris TaxID=2732487 RepID=A0A6M4HDD1_9PROT|nr:hypothetical protein [Usitatibacter palustris]QJR16574.1 hypothetical protein DSM104440_03409 [Usitatibacter palustris]
MTRILASLALLAVSAFAGDAHAFCVYNGLKDRAVFATVVAPTNVPKPAKLYGETVAPGKESCCNPKNTECNPGRVGDQALIAFEARVEAKAPVPPGVPPQVVACGRPVTDKNDKRFPSGVETPIPARSYLRFEHNPAFIPQQKYGWENPPYVLKVLVGPENRLVQTFPCPPKQADKPGRIDFLK